MNIYRFAGFLLFTSLCAFAADYEVEMNEGGRKVKGIVSLSASELRFIEGRNGDPTAFVISRSDIQKVRDADGRLTLQLAQPFTYRGSNRTQLTFKAERKESHKIMTWAGQPDVVESEADRAAGIDRWQDVSMTVEHRHAGKDRCSGNLVSGPDGLRYESTTLPEHNRTWNYSNIERFGRNSKASEVTVQSRDGDIYIMAGGRTGSDASIFDIISKRMSSIPK